MKAVRLLEYGGELVFDDVPTPTIAHDEILVKIKSTAVNHLDLVKDASGTVEPDTSRLNYRGYLVMSSQEWSNRLAATSRHTRQVMPCSLPTRLAARTRSIWPSRRRQSQGNLPTSHLREGHPCRWPAKLGGRDIFTHGHLGKGTNDS